MNAEHVEVLRELLSRCQFERYKEGADAIEAAIAALSAEGGASDEMEADNAKAADNAALMVIGMGYAWDGNTWNLARPSAEDKPVAYRFRRSEHESWYYDQYPKAWWECQPLYSASAAAATGGMVLVPREPTDEMVERGVRGAAWQGNPVEATQRECRRIYAAMLAAAPQEGETPHVDHGCGNAYREPA